jgi:hypothetical protein
MKTIFLLLTIALCLICFSSVRGQNNIRTYQGKIIMRHHLSGEKPCIKKGTGDYVDSLRMTPDLRRIIENVVGIYDIYAKECYADSFKVNIHHTNSKGLGCLYDDGCFVQEHYWDEWRHTGTSFQGFIAWLKKQLER